ncbi:sulfatase [Actinosynnema sp. NPDC020468]|uniref:sulfatase n=1 Tax=Actinosynnema sp. NPDC020468 TaxID=3154488 RepID=UPI0033D4F6E5
MNRSGLVEQAADGRADRRGTRARRVLAVGATVVAALLVWVALLAPADLSRFSVPAFLRVPVEALVAVVLLLVLPPRARRVVAVVLGVLLGLLVVLKALDIGFDLVLYRPFDLVLDWPLLGPALDFVRVTYGGVGAVVAVGSAVLLALGVIAAVVWAVTRLAGVVGRRRTAATRAVVVFAVAWITVSAPGLALEPGTPLAAHSAATLVGDHARAVAAGLRDRDEFDRVSTVDAFRGTPADELLTSLRGKDVMVVFVESYGRSAVEDPALSPVVDAALDAGTRQLDAAGFASRSGFLTSPTAGGGSWLAQATLLSGLRVDNQQRYRTLVAGDRLTLTSAFHQASWRSVGVLPGITQAWPEGRFFGYDRIYAAADVGYAGPRFGYATMPDQYALGAFQRAERAPGHRPVMAAMPLVSSHAPWSPVPKPVDWNALGDGSVFAGGGSDDPPESIFGRDPATVRTDYATSIAYSIDTLVSYVRTYGDDNLVLLFLGDHQPAQVVTGEGATKDVPITLVARDRAVLAHTDPWSWTPGLNPAPTAPTWPMESFRDRFLTAFR